MSAQIEQILALMQSESSLNSHRTSALLKELEQYQNANESAYQTLARQVDAYHGELRVYRAEAAALPRKT